jgi:hypothetical protein
MYVYGTLLHSVAVCNIRICMHEVVALKVEQMRWWAVLVETGGPY